MALPRASLILIVYGLILAGSGITGFAQSGFSPKAKSGLFIGGGSCVIIIALALLHALSNPRVSTIALRVAYVLTVVFTGVFGWRASKAYGGGPEKSYVFNLLVVMGIASFFTLVALVALPSSNQPESTTPISEKKKS